MSPELTGDLGGQVLDVMRISGPSAIPASRDVLPRVVEAPLLNACYEFYDKNIRTVISSANANDVVAGEAYITLDMNTMSDANLKVVQEMGLEVSTIPVTDTDVLVVANLLIPVSPNTTASELSQNAVELAKKFVIQPFSWVLKYTFDELKQTNPNLSEDQLRYELSKDPDLYFDEVEGVFYLSEEQYKKAKEAPGE